MDECTVIVKYDFIVCLVQSTVFAAWNTLVHAFHVFTNELSLAKLQPHTLLLTRRETWQRAPSHVPTDANFACCHAICIFRRSRVGARLSTGTDSRIAGKIPL